MRIVTLLLGEVTFWPWIQSPWYFVYGEGELPSKVLNTLLMTLATQYVTEPLLETMGLKGLPVL